MSPTVEELISHRLMINSALATVDKISLPEIVEIEDDRGESCHHLLRLLGIMNSTTVSSLSNESPPYLPKRMYFIPIRTRIQKEFWGKLFPNRERVLVKFGKSGVRKIVRSAAVRAFPIRSLLEGIDES